MPPCPKRDTDVRERIGGAGKEGEIASGSKRVEASPVRRHPSSRFSPSRRGGPFIVIHALPVAGNESTRDARSISGDPPPSPLARDTRRAAPRKMSRRRASARSHREAVLYYPRVPRSSAPFYLPPSSFQPPPFALENSLKEFILRCGAFGIVD